LIGLEDQSAFPKLPRTQAANIVKPAGRQRLDGKKELRHPPAGVTLVEPR